jgi:hypothetical protein
MVLLESGKGPKSNFRSTEATASSTLTENISANMGRGIPNA